ncbi:uncharacterized protein V1510DRAFT_412524 [Dipodascopsis tothii]|uniref:uncharacterized protein n=1 Tax=Dipodascopsis tothii TaxID=44089 RepID=UPI0034CFFE36
MMPMRITSRIEPSRNSTAKVISGIKIATRAAIWGSSMVIVHRGHDRSSGCGSSPAAALIRAGVAILAGGASFVYFTT